jgi:transcriptional regulator with XRE-family HTH domain
MTTKGFPTRLRDLRVGYGFTQEEVARELNISHRCISYYETGEREPDIETIGRLASFFGVTSDYLIGYGERPKRDPQSTWNGIEVFPKKYPDRLKAARNKKGLPQHRVAHLLNTTQGTIAKYETGKLEPNISMLGKFSDFYNVTVDWLIGLTETVLAA